MCADLMSRLIDAPRDYLIKLDGEDDRTYEDSAINSNNFELRYFAPYREDLYHFPRERPTLPDIDIEIRRRIQKCKFSKWQNKSRFCCSKLCNIYLKQTPNR